MAIDFTSREIQIPIRTLTPIWTGDIDGKADNRLLVSGLMGSLRWWWEVLQRGVSAPIPDLPQSATQGDRASAIFGMTGYRRRFRLILRETSELRVVPIAKKIPSPTGPKAWYFKSNALAGKFVLGVIPLEPNGFDPRIVAELVSFISRVGALGARPQMGFGVIEANLIRPSLIAERLREDVFGGPMGAKLAEKFPVAINEDRKLHDHGLPALHNMFFAQVEPKTPHPSDEATTFLLKSEIRNLYRHDTLLRHWFCGNVVPGSDEREGSKVMVSRPYRVNDKTLVRIWGWYPREIEDESLRSRRSSTLDHLHDYLSANHRLVSWREMGSPRDTRVQKDSILFYLDLMGLLPA